ncbi:MAG: PEP-CTERM sorting domain-containing protein, partial [Planctomycetaceae bacterium]
LPLIDDNGSTGGLVANRTGAQSAILALNDHQILILARDGNGRGASGAPVFKSILLADLNGATNVVGQYDGGTDQVAPSGVLRPSITPLSWVEALNLLGKLDLNVTELEQFGFNLNTAPGDVNTLTEKWEALSLVSALDPSRPHDYFLFVGNDNDFLTRSGKYLKADGTLGTYDSNLENDSIVLAFRVTAVPEPGTVCLSLMGVAGLVVLRRRRR